MGSFSIRWHFAVAVLGTVLCFAAPARAQLDDPATLHTGSGANTACPTGGTNSAGPCQYLYQHTEVNAVTNGTTPGTGTLDIYQNQGGAAALNDPMLLIIGVPNDKVVSGSGSTAQGTLSSVGAGVITGIQLYTSYNSGITTNKPSTTTETWTFGTTQYGLNGDGFEGLMKSGDVYNSFLNLPGNGIDNSNSFTNWSAADLAVDNVNVTDFGIYVFAINGPTGSTGLGAQDLLNIAFQDLPEGTFAVAYGSDGKHVYVNPFTESGNVDSPPSGGDTPSVPEPATLALFGGALLGMGWLRRRRA